MKVLIAGLGSIGQRHARNLRAIFGDMVEILAYRVRGLPHVITEAMTLDHTQSVQRTYGVRVFARLEDALAEQPQAVFVCNPTRDHGSTALAAVRAGCHVFVEKPLADNEAEAAALVAAADQAQRVVAVGYQMRCHPALQHVRQVLGERQLGRIVSVRAEMGEYLPDAHPYEDYRISYAARAALGGGVLLCFIHEFDYLHWLFGAPSRVFAVGGRLGALDVDVEDTALTTLACADEGQVLPVQVHHTFLERPPSRRCRIVGEHGRLDLDLISGVLTLSHADGRIDERRFDVRRNDLFLAEMRHFFAAIAGQPAAIVTAREAAVSLRVALAAKQSLATGQVVELAAA